MVQGSGLTPPPSLPKGSPPLWCGVVCFAPLPVVSSVGVGWAL